MKTVFFTYSDENVQALISRLYGKMKAWVNRHFGADSGVNAEDVLQEVFFRLLVKRPRVPADKIDGYVFSMVRNECTNLATRHPRTISLDNTSSEAAWDILSSIDMEDSLIGIRESTSISDIISFSESFDPRTQEIFNLSRIEGLTHEEIARRTGLSTRAIEKRLRSSVDAYCKRFPKS